MDREHTRFSTVVIRTQYFAYFGVMGMTLPYFNLYCYHLGFTGFQIGAMSAIRSVVLILFAVLWGHLADRFQIRRPIYIICNFAAAAVWLCLFYTHEFYLVLMIMVLYGIFSAPIISFLEAFTMDVLGKEKKRYGRTRAWGSLSFILVVILLGKAIDIYTVQIILMLVFIGSLLQALVATGIPRMKTPPRSAVATETKGLFRRQVIVFLACSFLMLVSHGAYYAFLSIHLENLGYSAPLIGVIWALASMAEIVIMMTSDRLFKRFSFESVLTFSFFAATLRWLILCTSTSAPVVLCSQVLHAATYGAFHMASILFMDSLMSAKTKTTGQAANNAVTYGLGLMVGFFISGYLYEQAGPVVMFAVSAAIAFVGGSAFWGFQRFELKRGCR